MPAEREQGPTALSGPHPDASLFEMIKRRDTLSERLDRTPSLSDEEGAALLKAVEMIEAEVGRYPITTVEGFAAFARMIRSAAYGNEVSLDSNDHPSRLLQALFNRLEAL